MRVASLTFPGGHWNANLVCCARGAKGGAAEPLSPGSAAAHLSRSRWTARAAATAPARGHAARGWRSRQNQAADHAHVPAGAGRRHGDADLDLATATFTCAPALQPLTCPMVGMSRALQGRGGCLPPATTVVPARAGCRAGRQLGAPAGSLAGRGSGGGPAALVQRPRRCWRPVRSGGRASVARRPQCRSRGAAPRPRLRSGSRGGRRSGGR